MSTKTFPACANGLCDQGRRICPTPQACQVPEPDATLLVFRPLALWRALTPAGRFWLGYFGGVGTLAAVLLGVHLWARAA